MPLTAIQREALAVIAGNRSADSHFAGGLVINSGDDSPRYSHDFDIFHDAELEVARSSDTDVASLEAAGFAVEKVRGDWSGPTSFRKASVSKDDARIEIDWALDSAFRFFPVEPDRALAWRLHLFDAATNKALALGARSVTRDYVEVGSSREFDQGLCDASGQAGQLRHIERRLRADESGIF